MRIWPTVQVAGLLGAAALAAGGCVVGPDYEPPTEAAAGGAWRAGGGSGPLAEGPAEVAGWWEKFGDERLTRLADRLVGQNLTLAEARQRVVEARARRGVVNADRLPTLDATADYFRAATGEEGINFRGPPPGQEADVFALVGSAAWELDLWGRVARQVQSADAEIDLGVEDYRDAAVSALADVAGDYIEAVALAGRMEVVRRNVEIQERSLAVIRSQVEAGQTGELDLRQAERLLAQTQARLPDLRRQRAAAESRIALLLGTTPADAAAAGLFEVPGDPAGSLATLPGAIGLGLPADLLSRRADVRRAEREYAAAFYEIGAAEAERYPRVSLGGTFALQAGETESLFDAKSFVYSVGPSVTLPLFEGGRIGANVRVQKAQAEQARLRYVRAVLRAVGETESAARGVVETRKRVADLERAVAAANKGVTLADELYRLGVRGILQLIDAQRELVAVEDELLLARQSAAQETVSLYRALGGGWEGVPLAAGKNTQP